MTFIVLTTLNSFPTLQMQLLLIFSLIQQCLLLTSQPYETTLLNLLSFFNEISVSIYLYLTLLLSDYLESQLISTDDGTQLLTVRTHVAWILTLLLSSVILINCLYVLVMKLLDVGRFIRERINSKETEMSHSQIVKMKPICLPN